MKKINNKMNSKGQIFSIDMILAGVVFLLILTLIATYSNHTANRVDIIESDNERDETANLVSNSLIYSQGNPLNWENKTITGISSIGIIKERNVIDKQKLQQLVDLNTGNYEEVKDLLGASKYGLKIELEALQNGQMIAEFGIDPSTEEKVSSANRFAFYDGEEVLLRVKVFEWKKEL